MAPLLTPRTAAILELANANLVHFNGTAIRARTIVTGYLVSTGDTRPRATIYRDPATAVLARETEAELGRAYRAMFG